MEKPVPQMGLVLYHNNIIIVLNFQWPIVNFEVVHYIRDIPRVAINTL